MTTNYQRGRAREYRACRKLWKQGAIDVHRSWGSHTMFDIRAVFPNKVRLIQVKKSYISKAEYRRLKEFAEKIKADNISVEIWNNPERGKWQFELL